MKPIINPEKQKIIVVAITAGAAFFGLQAVARAIALYQIPIFWSVALYMYLFLVTWQSFIFDLHLKKSYTWGSLEKTFWSALKERYRYMAERHHFLHYQNYLILPTIIYWSAIGLVFLNPFDYLLKQVVIFGASLGLAMATWYLKTVFYDHHNAHHNIRQTIFLVKLVAMYLSFAAVYGLARYFGLDVVWFGIAIFGISFLLFHQAFFQHHYNGWRTVEIFAISGLIIAEAAALVYLFWNVNYFSGALVIAAVYTTSWGIVQHKYIDHNLTREIVYEYLSVLFVILVLVFSMTNFGQQI